MMDYEEKMLRLLVEAYRKSKKDSGTNQIVRRTRLDPAKLYADYRKNSADFAQIEAVNVAAQQCRKMGFLTYETKGYSSEIETLILEDAKVEKIEVYLKERYGYVSKQEKRRDVERILKIYGQQSPGAELECKKLRMALEKNRIPKDYPQTEQVLKALAFIENNQTPLYLREASMLIYGSSKYFEENTLETVCHLLRQVKNRPCREDEFLDEILADYQIIKEKQKLCIKGAVTLLLHGTPVDVSLFADGVEFFSDELAALEAVTLHASRFVTVENRTSYFRCGGKDTVYFYLGGYTTRYQRDFFKLVYRDNPAVSYLHFGDIDAGGFYICEHLRRVTGIPFQSEKMSVSILQDARFSSCLQPLTENDRTRLRAIPKESEFYGTAVYMLEQGVKLEQEIVSLSEAV